MKMKFSLIGTAAALCLTSNIALADAVLTSPNGQVRIGINDGGQLVNDGIGIGYNFTGQGGLTGFYDALSPGCACEAWGVSANGIGGQIGETTGTTNINVLAPTTGAGFFQSNAQLTTLPGLSISQKFSIGTQTATGALFKAEVSITNTTGAAMTDVRYARAMDWDVPPTPFDEFVEHKGVSTTETLIRATDNGFANANPLTADTDTGIAAAPNTEGDQGGIDDHGSLFVFGFGNLAAGETYTFSIFYGAGLNRGDALALLGSVSPELYSLGQSSVGGSRSDDLPTYVFAFSGVGGDVVVPPPTTPVPEPASLGLFGIGLAGLGYVRHKRRARG